MSPLRGLRLSLLALSLLLLGAIAVFALGSPVAAGQAEIAFLEIDGMDCPRDSATGVFYFPVAPACSDTRLLFSVRAFAADGSELEVEQPGFCRVDFGRDIELISSGGPITLRLTNLAIVAVDGLGQTELTRDDTGCEVTVYDPQYFLSNKRDYISTSTALIHLRGRTAAYFDKKSYRLELCDQNGEGVNLPLLGMDSDDDWALDSLYSDPSRLRNKVMSELWSEINDSGGYEQIDLAAEYCELFIDGEYMGLYTLKQPFTVKRSGIDKEGNSYLFKVTDTPVDETEAHLRNGYLELKFPVEGVEDFSALWSGVEYYMNEAAAAADLTSPLELGRYYDLDNLADYWLFVNALYSPDNRLKNYYLSMDDNRPMQITPWDMDMSLGLIYSNYSPTLSLHITHNLLDDVWRPRLVDLPLTLSAREAGNPDFLAALAGRWPELRQGVLSYEHICELIDRSVAEMTLSGAFERDCNRWYYTDLEAETAHMKSFLGERLAFIDSYINTLNEG